MIQQVYLDTFVIGGCCDHEWQQWSLALMRNIRIGLFMPVISDLTESELINAPQDVQTICDELTNMDCRRIEESAESLDLASKYIAEGILSQNYENDARHIAVATIGEVDILVSWNFRHIVHYDKIHRFNAVNVLRRYKPLQIHTPMEVAHEEI